MQTNKDNEFELNSDEFKLPSDEFAAVSDEHAVSGDECNFNLLAKEDNSTAKDFEKPDIKKDPRRRLLMKVACSALVVTTVATSYGIDILGKDSLGKNALTNSVSVSYDPYAEGDLYASGGIIPDDIYVPEPTLEPDLPHGVNSENANLSVSYYVGEDWNSNSYSTILCYFDAETDSFICIDGYQEGQEPYGKIKYDFISNTLYLSDARIKNISVRDMGADFKIKLSGYNTYASIISESVEDCCSVTILGSGSLITTNLSTAGPGAGIFLRSKGSNSSLNIGGDVTLTMCGRNYAVWVRDTLASEPITFFEYDGVTPKILNPYDEVVATTMTISHIESADGEWGGFIGRRESNGSLSFATTVKIGTE